MVEHTQNNTIEDRRFYRAKGTIKAHGVLSIIFGGIGVLAGALFVAVFAAALAQDPTYDGGDISTLGLVMLGIMAFIFWALPHAYLIIAGLLLVKDPSPKLAKGLLITNLVIGVFCNLVLFIIAIINLTQLADYERGYTEKSA